MKKNYLCLIIAILFFTQQIFSQPTLPEFGVYSAEEIDLKECPFEKNAEAVILLDEAYSDYGDNYELITRHRIRIKILNDRGIDRGNITIPFYSKEDFEYIKGIQGISFLDNTL